MGGLTLLQPWGQRSVAALLAVCCVRCGPCRLLCSGRVPCGGKHIIIINSTRQHDGPPMPHMPG